jgi:hypothetical protein
MSYRKTFNDIVVYCVKYKKKMPPQQIWYIEDQLEWKEPKTFKKQKSIFLLHVNHLPQQSHSIN